METNEVNQGEENRRRERFELKYNILCFKCCDPVNSVATIIPFLFHIVDISYGGLGISSEHRLHSDSILTFNMKNKFGLRELNVEVKWCKFVDGVYRSGVHFINLTYEDIIFIDEIVKYLR